MNLIYLYKIEHFLYSKKLLLCAKLIQAIIFTLYNSYVPYSCKIGKNTKFAYKGIGVVIHSRAIIGKNCIIGQNITIGGRSKSTVVPVIGDNVYLSAGSRILGNICIGNNVVIGANAVMINDAPDNTVWAGVPAKLIKKNISISDYI